MYPEAGLMVDMPEIFHAVSKQYTTTQREILSAVFQDQLGTYASDSQKANIALLQESNAFVVATGQQIHLGMGPALVLFKILSTIQRCNQLKIQFPENHFIPVFWMATEDHDVEEIRHFVGPKETFSWDLTWKTAVGDIPTEGLQPWFDGLIRQYNHSPNALKSLEAWSELHLKPGATLASVTSEWISNIFGESGLLVLDPRDLRLKSMAKSLFEKALSSDTLTQAFLAGTEKLKAEGHTPAAHVGKTQVFWMDSERRSRIDTTNTGFKTADNELFWTEAEMRDALQSNAIGNLSANVLLRPLYQQTILPCVTYIAGPSEYMYWLQTAQAFECVDAVRPQLLHRKGGVVLNASQRKKLDKLGLSEARWFDGLTSIKEQVLQKHVGENDLLTANKALEEILEKQLKTLYQWNSPELPEAKKQVEAILKWQRTLGKTATETYLESLFSSEAWHSLSNLISTQFSVEKPQERQLYWLPWILIHGEDWLKTLAESNAYDAETAFWLIEL